MPDGMVVRPARASDFEDWYALFEAVAGEGRWIGAEAPLDRAWAGPMFDRTLDSHRAATLVAEADGRLVGHLGVTLTHGYADLGMMVGAGHRRRGIGSALVEACVAWCRAHDAHKVGLTVWPHNHAAIALYERHGFVAEGRLVRHHRRRDGALWDAVVMGLVLDTTSPGLTP